ncbi:MAG: enoate reductase [Treponema sp.]|nr:MAG: enoate reductase [Treponema sp.]
MKTDKQIQEMVDHFAFWGGDEAKKNEAGGTGTFSENLAPYTALFEPLQINRMQVKNRTVMAPMGNIDMCEETGRPNAQMIEYFVERARGGVGLITTGLVPISHGIDNSITELDKLTYFPRIDRSRTVLAGWRALAQGVHSFGTKIFVQLTAGLGRVGNPQCLTEQMKFPVSASFNPNFYIPQIPCLRLSDRKLKKIIKNTGQGAADAKACGLDGVYLHGHEGYLLEQLANRAFNRRTIGRFSNWQKFGLDMVHEIRRRVGNHYPIMYRIDLSLALNEIYGEEGMSIKALKKFKNGRLPDETLDYMKNLVKAGVDIFDVDLGCYDNWWLPHPPSSMPAACFLPVARRVKEFFEKEGIISNAGVPVPIVAVGKLGYPDIAEQALRNKDCDMVMLGRPLLADPHWVNKVYAGDIKGIRPCIGCQEGCVNEFVEGGHPQCAVNPRSGFEYKYPSKLTSAKKPKRIAIVGGGPAGIVTALVAAERGHKVTLFEKNEMLAGRLNPGSVPIIKFDVQNYKEYLIRNVQKAEKAGNLTVKLNTEFTAERGKGEFDKIVVASGTDDITLPFTGLDKMRNVQAVDLLMKPELLENSKNPIIIGGGVVGCETAYWLAREKHCTPKIMEMTHHFMAGVCTANRAHLIDSLKKSGVDLLNCAKVTGFTDNNVNVEIIEGKKPNAYNTWQPILPENVENPLAPKYGTKTKEHSFPCDLAILALGGRSNKKLFYELQKNQIASAVHLLGDSFSAGKVLEAVRGAYALGISL